jgi:predicted aconitase with swiveling domain
MIRLLGSPTVARRAQGIALAAEIPLSFWGGFNPDTGEIIDQRHPLAGGVATDRVLVIPTGRGSCSGSGVLLESIHNGTAPAAIITSTVDQIIALGAILGDELYAQHPAIVVVSEQDRQRIATGDFVEIADDGWLTVTSSDESPVTNDSAAS